jgi:hypothetical protein
MGFRAMMTALGPEQAKPASQYTVGYPMVLSKSHRKSAIYTKSPTDFVWDLLSTMGYPMHRRRLANLDKIHGPRMRLVPKCSKFDGLSYETC